MTKGKPMSTDAADEHGFLDVGTPAYRRANLAMFVGGFATFAMLYGTQPILPLLRDTFAISPATARRTIWVIRLELLLLVCLPFLASLMARGVGYSS